MTTKVTRLAGKWTVLISQGDQHFTLNIAGDPTEKEAQIFKKRFDKALEENFEEWVNKQIF